MRSVTFQCPSCLKNLQYTNGDTPFQTCYRCKGKIIVPSTAVHQVEMEAARPTEFALREQKELKLAEIQNELNLGRKVEAIKTFRENFGTDLKTAKEAVEKLEKNKNLEIPKSALRENFSAIQENPAEHKLYQDTKQQNTPSKNSGASIFWLLVGIGIVLYILFGD